MMLARLFFMGIVMIACNAQGMDNQQVERDKQPPMKVERFAEIVERYQQEREKIDRVKQLMGEDVRERPSPEEIMRRFQSEGVVEKHPVQPFQNQSKARRALGFR